MNFKAKLVLLSLVFSLNAEASSAATSNESLLKLVPDSKVILEKGRERVLQTPQGTTIEIELKRDGSVEEASGFALASGDSFIPGNGLMNLADAAKALEKAGKKPLGKWSFENSLRYGWIYEFEGIENGQKRDYAVDAKNGQIVFDRVDY